MVEAPLSWSYASKILPKISRVQSLLDMGTGGGEFLSSLRPLPQHTCATEGYQPNRAIARQILEPLGVEVVEVGNDDMLPFEDNLFELIINRHESVLDNTETLLYSMAIPTRKESATSSRSRNGN